MRSGMTAFEAFRSSTRPEFGPLQKEVDYIVKEGKVLIAHHALTSNNHDVLLNAIVGNHG